MNFLQLIDIDWLRFLIPALGFVSMGFAEDDDGGDDKDDDKDSKDDKDDDLDDDDQDDKKDDDKKTFDYGYVKKLREEAKANRIKARELEDEKKKREDEELKKQGEHEKRANKIEEEAKAEKTKLTKRIKLSELKAEAKSQGIIDSDIVEIIKLDSVELDDDYKILNVKEIIEDFKEKHPKLFSDEDEDDDTRDPEDNKKPGRRDNKNLELDKMSEIELLEAGLSRDKKSKKRKH